MSYEKPFLTCSDHAVGVQCVERALGNSRALYYDQFDPNHSAGLGGMSLSDPFLGPGRHDDVLIARTAADFTIDTTISPSAALTLTSGPMIFGPPDRLKEGQWKIYMSSPRFFSAVATIKGASIGIARYATCWVSFDISGPYVVVSTWNVAGGILADYDFSLVIWAEGVS